MQGHRKVAEDHANKIHTLWLLIQGPSRLGPIMPHKSRLLPLSTTWHFMLATMNCWQFLAQLASMPWISSFSLAFAQPRYCLLLGASPERQGCAVTLLCSHSAPWTFHPIILLITLKSSVCAFIFPCRPVPCYTIATSHTWQWSLRHVAGPNADVSNT